MRFLYVSRQFNRSGYYILKHMLENTHYKPVGVLLPKPKAPQALDDPERAAQEEQRYLSEVQRFGGRPLRFMESIKRLAEDHGVRVYLRTGIKGDSSYEFLTKLDLDLIVLGGGWPQLIPRCVIQLPRLGIINTHPSLLPEFRGTDIHRWQILHGIAKSGVSIHYIDEGFDTGDILGQAEVDISAVDTPQDLFEKTARVSGPLMEEVLRHIEAADPGTVKGISQPARDDTSHYFSAWSWDDRDFLRLDWTDAAAKLERLVRASAQEAYVYNGPWFTFNGKSYLLRDADSVSEPEGGEPGQIAKLDEAGPVVQCGNGRLVLKSIQPATEKGWSEQPHHEPAEPGRNWARRHELQAGDSVG